MDMIFQPWVGEHYYTDNRFGHRILILGESHYGDDSEATSDFTSRVVQDLAKDQRSSFFTKVSKVLLGLNSSDWLDDKERGDVWDHVAFYNFIQGFVSTEARVRPTDDMWENSKEPFLKVINTLKPQIILVLGKALGANIPELGPEIKVCVIQHPSTGFSYEKWNPIFEEALGKTL
jgi:hypothetical protein